VRGQSGNKPRILLAEDDDAIRDMLQAALERDGFEVVAVANVRDARSDTSRQRSLTHFFPICTCHTPEMVLPLSAPCATPTDGARFGHHVRHGCYPLLNHSCGSRSQVRSFVLHVTAYKKVDVTNRVPTCLVKSAHIMARFVPPAFRDHCCFSPVISVPRDFPEGTRGKPCH
jgi:hypothetical protein